MSVDQTTDPRAHAPSFKLKFLHPRYTLSWLMIGVLALAVIMPNRLRYAVGGWIGDVFRKSNAKRRDIAQINLKACFPQLSGPEREQMLVDHFKSYGRSIIDLGVAWWGREKRLNSMVTINGLNYLTEAIERGESVILFTPHSAGLDFGGIMVSKHVPIVSMMKALSDPMQDWVLTRGRRRYNPDIYRRDQGLRPLMRALKNNYVCYYMPDEDFGGKNSVFAPFFDVPTSTLTTLGRMAAATGASVIPCFARILPAGAGYTVDIDPPIENFPTGDDVTDATRMNAALESGISRAPEQYMWTLRWFKTRPPGHEPLYR